MKKRRVLLAVLFACCAIQLHVNADGHSTDVENVTDKTYQNFTDVNGGALYAGSEKTGHVTNSTFTENKASDSGGAIYNEGEMTVNGSSFEKNIAEKNGGKGGGGGAIYNKGTITVDDSLFANNKAGKGEQVWQEEGHGGAVYNAANAVITNSTFRGNHAKYGGAIYNESIGNMTVGGEFIDNTAQTGGAIENDGGKLTVNSGSLFENNTVSRFDGGAILNENGTLNIEDNVTFRNNDSLSNEDYNGKRGGAIFSEGEGKSNIQIGNEVIFEGNKSEEGGGIDLYLHNTLTIGDDASFKNNKAGHCGGAISAYTYPLEEEKASEITIGNNALFEGNQAGFDDEKYSPENGVVFGGAISMIEGAQNKDNYTTFTIGKNAIFRNNKAGKDSSQYGYGGAIYNTAKFTIGENALFEKNTATYSGGAIYNNSEITIGANTEFKGNNASSMGGAIYNDQYGSLAIGENSVFDSNSAASMGGALFNYGTMKNPIEKASFLNNSSEYGGAVYAYTGSMEINNSLFRGNEAKNSGGALANQVTVKIESTLFENNISDSKGGAVYNVSNGTNPDLTVNNSLFTGNKSMVGGAIASSDKAGHTITTKITQSTFQNNYAAEKKTRDVEPMGGQGGAIWTGASESNTLTVEGSVFENNTAEAEGGAIWSGNTTTVANSLFKGNKTTGTQFTAEHPDYKNDREGGGAIFVGSSSKMEIKSSDFVNNLSETIGGAIATRSNAAKEASPLTVSNSTFSGNSAVYNGGAIASYTTTNLTDTSFVNNKAGGRGGAIWANGDVTIKAEQGDVVFIGNSAEDGGDIYMDNLSSSGSVGTLNLNAAEDKNITIADGISGSKQYNVTLDGEGKVTFNSEIKNANMQVTKGTLHLAEGSSLGEGTTVNVTNATLDSQDGRINDYGEKVKIGSGSKIKFDISSAAKTTDKFSMADGVSGGEVKVEDFNFLPDTLLSSGNITADEIKDSLGLGEVVLELPDKEFTTLTPLRYVNVKSGESGLSYTPTGNTYNDFNPAVMAAPVAAQLGGYLTQLESYDEAFRNMDMYMIMPKSMRQAMKFKNKYASSDSDWNVIYDKSANQYDNTALWARPYASFENVRLKRGPKVSNVAWGTYLGGDSQLYDLGNGWEGMWSLYAGYNGSHQAYNGISIYQNGGTLGLTGTLYKNNFFTGLTANAGANSAEASTSYGDDSFSLFRTGVASKTGYNLEFADGKFIIQPSWLMSYSFVNTEDYITSSGLKINSNPLNVMHIEPGLKFIGNTNNGWQPYTGLSIVWNLFDKTDFMASDATLPELSVKPFFKYGVGLRKLYGERFVGYGQTYLTSGGRNGVGFQFGGRWTI